MTYYYIGGKEMFYSTTHLIVLALSSVTWQSALLVTYAIYYYRELKRRFSIMSTSCIWWEPVGMVLTMVADCSIHYNTKGPTTTGQKWKHQQQEEQQDTSIHNDTKKIFRHHQPVCGRECDIKWLLEGGQNKLLDSDSEGEWLWCIGLWTRFLVEKKPR